MYVVYYIIIRERFCGLGILLRSLYSAVYYTVLCRYIKNVYVLQFLVVKCFSRSDDDDPMAGSLA